MNDLARSVAAPFGVAIAPCAEFIDQEIGQQQVNIFVLDRNIATCARYHADQHVVKMILEGTQMLCTVLHRYGIDAPYKPTHTKHPCTLWAGRSLANWLWLRDLTLALNLEFRYRFNGIADHRSALVAKLLPLPPIAAIGLTEFEQVMPNTYKVPGDPVQAYRNFYVGEKSRFAAWTRRRLPRWYMESLRTARRQKGFRLDSGPFR